MTDNPSNEIQGDIEESMPFDEVVASVRAVESPVDDKRIRRTRTVTVIILILLILLILAACASMYALLKPGGLELGGTSNAGITWIRSIYGHGTIYDDMINPVHISFSADGNSIYVADASRFRVVEYGINGQLKRIIPMQFALNGVTFPSAIAVAPNGRIIIGEQTYDKVHIFDSNFNLIRTLEIETPMSVAASNNMILVGSRHGFAAYTIDGELIGTKGGTGETGDDFDYVLSLKLDATDNAYVLDSYNNRLLKYDADGNLIYEVLTGVPGNEGIEGGRSFKNEEIVEKYPANMQLPQGLVLDNAGRVLIIDFLDFTVAAFDAQTGGFIEKYGQEGMEDGRFYYPNDLAYSPSNDMFASAEANLGRVQLFGIDGSSTNPLSNLRRQLGDLLSACCIPLLIILAILVLYFVTKALAKRRTEQEAIVVIEDEGVIENVADA
jgi:sugar lactone lactonase YvrE